jgi:D-alanyl-lipoteichoic acid acyltransferase DltB (MBOAT superfamily)
LSGLWHGANWTFVLWGVLHGIAMMFYRFFKKALDKAPPVILWLATFAFVNFAWVFFRAESFRNGLSIFKRILLGGGGGISAEMGKALFGRNLEHTWGRFAPYEAIASVLTECNGYVWLLLGLILALWLPNTHELVGKIMKYSRGWNILIAVLALCSIVSLSEVMAFLYFNF